MAVDVPGGLFGDRNPLIDDGKRTYTLSRPQRHKRIVMPGWAVIGAATFIAGGLQNYKNEQGFETTFHLMNESGASRNSTVVIENLTTGKTLVSGNVDLVDGAFTNQAFSWSLEKIRPGDSIKFTLGNEGIGTANSSGTYAWSATGSSFHLDDNVAYHYPTAGEGTITLDATTVAVCPVYLPQGAVVTGCAVWGSESNETWTLYRCDVGGQPAGTPLASANQNSEDTSISNATINNNAYRYWIETSSMSSTDIIYGARITYTLADRHNSTAGYYEFELNGFFKSDGESSNE